MTQSRLFPISSTVRGFTLIELIGVMAIIVILASVGAEAISTRIRVTQRNTEQQNLDRIADTFREQVARARAIPDPATWTQFVCGPLGLSPAQVSTNRSGNVRILRYDPAFRVGADSRSPSTSSSPIEQTSLGSINPVNPRAILVTSTADSLPDFSSVSFDALWNCAVDSLPAGWPAWNSSRTDLKLARIDLRTLFARVVLQNNDPFNDAHYAVQTPADTVSVTPGNVAEMWCYRGSILFLNQNANTIQAAEVVHDEVSFIYEEGRWNRRVILGRDPKLGSFASTADTFLHSATPPATDKQLGATQQAIVEEMYQFMIQYSRWSAKGFPGGTGPLAQIPEFRTLSDSASRLGAFSLNLLGTD